MGSGESYKTSNSNNGLTPMGSLNQSECEPRSIGTRCDREGENWIGKKTSSSCKKSVSLSLRAKRNKVD